MYNQRGLPSASRTSLGLDERLERVLCYLLLWVSGLFFLIFERNPSVRRHALQSVIVFGTLSVILFVLSLFGGVLGAIPLIGWIFSIAFGLVHAVVWIVTAIAWIFLMLAAYFSPATFVGGRNSGY
jgi:uncharacterized membrane protein